MFRKKIPVGRFIPPFFLRKCRIWPFLNYLHDSNSFFFWAQGIKSELFFGRTVKLRFTVPLKPRQCRRPIQKLHRNENSWLTPEHQCTCWTERIWAQKNWRLCGDPEPPQWGGNGQWRSANNRKSTRTCLRSWSLRDSASTRRHACSSITWKAQEHGYTYEWTSGQKPYLTKQGKKILCKTENVVLLVVSGSSSNSGTSSSSTSLPQDSSTTASSQASERSDDQPPGNWRDSPKKLKTKIKRRDDNRESGDRWRDLPEWLEGFCARIVFKLELKFVFHIVPAGLIEYFSESGKITMWRYPRSSIGKPRRSSPKSKTNMKKKGNNQATRSRLRDLPEWLEEFTDNLEDAAVPAPAHISQDSDSERPTKVSPTGSTVFFLTSRKIETAKSACEPKWFGHLAEDALANLFFEQQKFGDLMTADHFCPQWGRWISKQSPMRSRGTRSSHSMDSVQPCKTRTSQETDKSLRKFLEPSEKPKVIYTDNSLEFGKSCEDWSWNHCTFNTHRSETNGTAERAVRSIKEGTSAALLQSGLGEKWWVDSMECSCYLRNVQDLVADGKTPCERRFREAIKKAQWFLLGQWLNLVSCPISARAQSTLHQCGKKVLPGIVLGCALIAGWIWKGDIMVADIQELETMDASEIHPRRINAKEVLTPQRGEEFLFPVADGTAKLSGKDHEFREPAQRQERLERSDDLRGELQGEPEGFQLTETKDDAECLERFLVDFEFNSLCRKKKHAQFHCNTLMWAELLVQIWMCLQEKTYWRPLECARESKFIRFLERIHEVHIIERKIFWKGFLWSREETDNNSSNYQDLRTCGLKFGPTLGKAAQKREKQEWANEKPEARQRSKAERYLFHRSGRWWMQRNHQKTQGESWKFHWWRQCLAKKEQSSTPGFRKLSRRVMNPTRFQRQSMHASWRFMSPRDNVWNHPYRKIMKIISQAKDIIRWLITIWCTSLFRCLQVMNIPDATGSSGQGMEEARSDSGLAVGQS